MKVHNSLIQIHKMVEDTLKDQSQQLKARVLIRSNTTVLQLYTGTSDIVLNVEYTTDYTNPERSNEHAEELWECVGEWIMNKDVIIDLEIHEVE